MYPPTGILDDDLWSRSASMFHRKRRKVGSQLTHLNGEEDNRSAPERTDARLSRECGCGQVLVGIDEVVVGTVVEEDEAEADAPAAHCWTSPAQMWVGRPCKDEHADCDEPGHTISGMQMFQGWEFGILPATVHHRY